jgi:hypothetical protein
MTTGRTATVEIETIDGTGQPVPVFHAALRSLQDVFSAVGSFTPAPVNPAIRSRIVNAGAGRFQIGQFTIAVAVLP